MEASSSSNAPSTPPLPHPHHHFTPSFHSRRFTPYKMLSAKPPRRGKPDCSGQPNAPPPCTECGRRFISWKALFGHMRCHPERTWRGINPPPPPAQSPRAQFTDEEYQVAATLLLLANGPPLETPSGELSAAALIIRSLPSSSSDGSIRRKKGMGFRTHFSPSSFSTSFCYSQNPDCLLDLNMPPPLESAEGGAAPVLELKLGI